MDTWSAVKQRASKVPTLVETSLALPPTAFHEVLIAGCGTGNELDALAEVFPNASITGIDIRPASQPGSSGRITREVMDIQRLRFADASFDFIYCNHVLEHVDHPDDALSELARVLQRPGVVLFSTPNRLRLLGYIGSDDATLAQKLRWNLDDYRARLSGRWHNPTSHAGFSVRELYRLAAPHFDWVRPIQKLYFGAKYTRATSIVDALCWTRFGSFLFPSVNFIATKGYQIPKRVC